MRQRKNLGGALLNADVTQELQDPDDIAAIRQSVRALCAKFPGEYWRKLDRERAYPGEFVDLDQLCISPQCGFASSEEGNTLAEDQQLAKLRMIVEIADEVWG